MNHNNNNEKSPSPADESRTICDKRLVVATPFYSECIGWASQSRCPSAPDKPNVDRGVPRMCVFQWLTGSDKAHLVVTVLCGPTFASTWFRLSICIYKQIRRIAQSAAKCTTHTHTFTHHHHHHPGEKRQGASIIDTQLVFLSYSVLLLLYFVDSLTPFQESRASQYFHTMKSCFFFLLHILLKLLLK